MKNKTVEITKYVDWKDTDGLLDSICDSLRELGITMVENPDVEGNDMYSFIFMKEDYDKEELYDELKSITYVHEDDEYDEERANEYFENLTEEEYHGKD